MDLTIIIVNFNVKEFLEQSINSIKKSCKNIQYELYVVDNASTDGSVELIRKKFPEVKLIANSENNGFAAANNQAINQAQGEYILLINPDTIVQEDTFSVILNFINKHPECGMVSCKILNPDGSLQLNCRRSFPTPWVAFTKIAGLSKLFPNSRLFGQYNLTYRDPDETYEVEAISGSFMFFRAQVVKDIGYLDESFFMYGEDLDWCFRTREAGWKIYYLPETKIIHFKGESSKKSEVDLILQFYRAMKLFVEKHYHNRYLHVPQWFLLLGITLRASLTFFSKFIRWIFPGLLDLVLLNSGIILGIYIRLGTVLPHLRSYFIVMVVYSLIWIICLTLTGGYGRAKYSAVRASYGVLVGLILNTSLTFFFNQYAFSRAVVLIAGVLNILFLSGWRLGLKIISRLPIFALKNFPGKSLVGRRALIVAPVVSGQRIVSRLKDQFDTGYEVCGIVSPEEGSIIGKFQDVLVLGQLKYLDAIIGQTRAQEIIFSTEQISYDQILEIISRSKKRKLNFKLIPSGMDVIIGKASVEYIGDLPLMDIDYRLNQPLNIFTKRMFDILMSVTALVFFMPEILFLIIFKRARLEHQRIFGVNEKKVSIARFSQTNLTSRQKKLPYFWSVFTGKLSLVGSEIIEVNDHKPPQSHIDLKPGLTGLAQINKYNSLANNESERYNLYYLKNYSLMLDIEIITKTVFKV